MKYNCTPVTSYKEEKELEEQELEKEQNTQDMSQDVIDENDDKE